MAIDISNLSPEELQALATAAQERIQVALNERYLKELEEEESRKERVAGAITRLTNLLGPEGAPPYVPGGEVPPSIRGLLAYPPEIMAQNSGIALQMLFQGLEELTITTRDLAGIMGLE